MRKLLASWALFLVAPALVGQCIQTSGTSYGSGDDFIANGGAGIDMGFAFPIGGVSYQYIHPSSNGFAHLSDGTVTLTNSDFSPSVAEMYTLEPRLAAFWRDLVLDALNNGELFVDTSIAGVCTVTWSNAVLFGQTTIFSLQLVIRDTGSWDVIYDGAVYQTFEAMVGVSPGFGTATPPPGSDLSSGAPILDDMAYELFPANAFDLAGLSLTMIPTVPGYVPAVGNGGCASKATYGEGCVSIANAAEEFFPINTIDICGSGTAITFLRTGSEYTILDGIPGVYVPPVAGVIVSASDDAFGIVPLSIPMPTAAGSTQSLQVCTNGYIGLSANQPSPLADYSPTSLEFAAFTEPTICGPWYDWSPNAGGQILYEEIGGIMYITWDAVTPYQVTTTDTFQYQFELATGNCTIVYDTMTYGGTSSWHGALFGYTAGNASYVDSLDMSAALPAVVSVPDIGSTPMALDSNLPVIGGNWDLTTTNIDPISPIAITFFGTARQDPGVPMVLIGLNAPGCDIFLNTIVGDLTVPAIGGAATATLPIPANPGLQGAVLTAQSVGLTLLNAANLLVSNGIEGTLGN